MKLSPTALLWIPFLVDATVPGSLRSAHSHREAEDSTARRRLDQPADENPATATFEAVGVIDLDFNPAYVFCDDFESGQGLTVSSFHNVALNPGAGPPFIPFERDLVAVIGDLESTDPVVQVLGPNATTDAVWPNQARRAPDDMFPFEAVVVPQGWFRVPHPGRLSVYSLEDDTIIDIHHATPDKPRFYHIVKFVDMDQDGALDMVTVRSGYKEGPNGLVSPPFGELVWFRNPGIEALRADIHTAWPEHVIAHGLGPDVSLDVKDMTGDGIPEIVATSIFAGLSKFDNTEWDSSSRVTLYGMPEGKPWSSGAEPRVAELVGDQGLMFSVELVDLDGDGRLDVLATNHQNAMEPIDGRVLGIKQPKSGKLFKDPWVVHVLKGDIRPSEAPPGQPNRRLAPGAAKSFSAPSGNAGKPWIAVSGDEASKAWVLKPTSEPWVYEEELLLDINDVYGEDTTSTPLQDPFGITISTIGEIGIREEEEQVTLYVPVFEAQDIHVFRSQKSSPSLGNEGVLVGGSRIGDGEEYNGYGSEYYFQSSAATSRLTITACIASLVASAVLVFV